jgi:hypothetical protein
MVPVLGLVLAACIHRSTPEPPATAESARPDFLDLQPGWRLRITTPLSPGSASVAEAATSGNTITLVAPAGFGYHTAYYAIRKDPAGGVLRFEFVSGSLSREGKTSSEPAGLGWEVQPAIDARVARLIYLSRLSASDHNMAVVAALNRPALERLTRMIDDNPEQGCANTGDSFCAWVPAGVAVVAEQMTTAGVWEPVR